MTIAKRVYTASLSALIVIGGALTAQAQKPVVPSRVLAEVKRFAHHTNQGECPSTRPSEN